MSTHTSIEERYRSLDLTDADVRAIESDWRAVGDDIRTAMKQVDQATEKAPGPPILPRRRVRVSVITTIGYYLVAAIFALVATIAMMGVLMLIGFALTGDWPRFI